MLAFELSTLNYYLVDGIWYIEIPKSNFAYEFKPQTVLIRNSLTGKERQFWVFREQKLLYAHRLIAPKLNANGFDTEWQDQRLITNWVILLT